jgi:hypothetical protein
LKDDEKTGYEILYDFACPVGLEDRSAPLREDCFGFLIKPGVRFKTVGK